MHIFNHSADPALYVLTLIKTHMVHISTYRAIFNSGCQMHCQASVKCLLEDGEQQGVDEALHVTAVADKQPQKDHFSIQTTHQSVI